MSKYDLEERTFHFAKDVRSLVKRLPRSICNLEAAKQVVRSSGSIGANYIEANEALSKKDFRVRLKISRKEAKETRSWLRLLDVGANQQLSSDRDKLTTESGELVRMLSAIINRS